VPLSDEVIMSYRGLPYDLLEGLLPHSSAWRQAGPHLMPNEGVATGRPITPLHGGHAGLRCTAGLLNGVFGQGDDRHIARCRSIKHVTTFVEEEEGGRRLSIIASSLVFIGEDDVSRVGSRPIELIDEKDGF
jgi:hypothetical protein